MARVCVCVEGGGGRCGRVSEGWGARPCTSPSAVALTASSDAQLCSQIAPRHTDSCRCRLMLTLRELSVQMRMKPAFTYAVRNLLWRRGLPCSGAHWKESTGQHRLQADCPEGTVSHFSGRARQSEHQRDTGSISSHFLEITFPPVCRQ